MPSCLGLYIEENLIKYAKVSKDHNTTKVESFGIKFYDKLSDAIKQVITETFSYKIPVSINLSEEMYNYFYMFSLINKKDMQKAIETEFSSYCYDKGINENVFESRFVLVNSLENKEQIKVIHIAANKTEINKRIQQLEGSRLSTITPISVSIANILDLKPKENCMVVNIEDKTTVTTISDQKIYNIDVLENGDGEFLRSIAAKENSMSKAYEICKNTTIYTMDAKELQEEENLYLEDIMPTLYTIVSNVKNIIDSGLIKIEKIYITGTAAVINNIDLYFQEIIKNIKCEILKPYFIENTPKISIKDYIEVNSAIATALQGLGDGLKGMNFRRERLGDKIPNSLKIDLGKDASGKKNSFAIRNDLNEELDQTESSLIRLAVCILVIVLVYSGFSVFLNEQYTKKNQEIQEATVQTQQQLSEVISVTSRIKEKTNAYIKLRQNLEEMTNKVTEQTGSKNAIPTLLSQLMYTISQDIQITSIENTTGKHIRINAQAEQYDQLGIFVAWLKNDEILYDVVLSPGVKESNVVKVVIEGELP